MIFLTQAYKVKKVSENIFANKMKFLCVFQCVCKALDSHKISQSKVRCPCNLMELP